MPVCTKAIAPSIPYTQHKPGKSGKQHSDQMPFSCSFKHPANDVEQCKGSMKNKEENIKEGIPHQVKLNPVE
jgi:hypothetical protein